MVRSTPEISCAVVFLTTPSSGEPPAWRKRSRVPRMAPGGLGCVSCVFGPPGLRPAKTMDSKNARTRFMKDRRPKFRSLLYIVQDDELYIVQDDERRHALRRPASRF